MYSKDSAISGFLPRIAKFKTSSPSSKFLSNSITTCSVFLSSWGADGLQRSLTEKFVSVFTGVASSTFDEWELVVVVVVPVWLVFTVVVFVELTLG